MQNFTFQPGTKRLIKIQILTLLLVTIFSVITHAQEDALNFQILEQTTKKQFFERQNFASGRFEWRPKEYYLSITPEVFLSRPAINYGGPETAVQDLTEKQAQEIIRYISRDEFYRFDLYATERFLKSRFNDAPFAIKKVYTMAPLEIEVNIEKGYEALKRYDRKHSTNFSQIAMFEYLQRILRQNLPSSLPENDILKDFRSGLQKFDKSLSLEIFDISKLAVDYFRARLELAEKHKVTDIQREIMTLAKSTAEYAQRVESPFNFMFFERTAQEMYNALYGKSSLSQNEILSRDTSRVLNNTYNSIIKTFVEEINSQSKAPKSTHFRFHEVDINIEVESIRVDKTLGNVTYIGNRENLEKIYSVKVINPTPKANQVILETVESLMKQPGVYGVYFDDRVKIPSKLDLNKYEVRELSDGRVLIRNVSLACSKLFS